MSGNFRKTILQNNVEEIDLLQKANERQNGLHLESRYVKLQLKENWTLKSSLSYLKEHLK